MPPRPSLRSAVFLDRDGTIIEERSYITRPDQVRLLPGAADALRLLRQAGQVCVVVTNQSAVGRGMITDAELKDIHAEMHRQLDEAGAAVDAVYYCAFAPSSKDRTASEHPERKPAPGMLLRAARELGLDVARSWMVGDMISDVLAGQRAGCRESILVRCGRDVSDTVNSLSGTGCVEENLLTAAARILRTLHCDQGTPCTASAA